MNPIITQQKTKIYELVQIINDYVNAKFDGSEASRLRIHYNDSGQSIRISQVDINIDNFTMWHSYNYDQLIIELLDNIYNELTQELESIQQYYTEAQQHNQDTRDTYNSLQPTL